MKIIIFGASGAGTSTLAKAFARENGYTYVEADDYYWLKTERPFETKRNPAERNQLFLEELNSHDKVVVAGSVFNWGPDIPGLFDFAVFLWLPPEIRMQRLILREKQRYGTLLDSDPWFKAENEAFITWASRYDEPGFAGRSLTHHKHWITQLKVPVLEISGDFPLAERLRRVQEKLAIISQKEPQR
ncbi:AAA family ATPase [Chitinophaga qingshengii]|uniref:AAA family ATPase n=1 Tax=Chitinophaga qingshengii TaxID=1569794 RepID=A0ABR7TG98_9BACT|nr:AAA family ATPase [Chitinophaga qingshengii]MBC9929447.1 AAA family ATPase [Chitinophaga qingshengii]